MDASGGMTAQLEHSLCSAQEKFSESLRSAASLMSKLEESFGPPQPLPEYSPAQEPAADVEHPSGESQYSPPPSYRASLAAQIPGLSAQGLAVLEQLEGPKHEAHEALQKSADFGAATQSTGRSSTSRSTTPAKVTLASLVSSSIANSPFNPHSQHAFAEKLDDLEQNVLVDEKSRMEAKHAEEIRALKQQLKESQQQASTFQVSRSLADGSLTVGVG